MEKKEAAIVRLNPFLFVLQPHIASRPAAKLCQYFWLDMKKIIWCESIEHYFFAVHMNKYFTAYSVHLFNLGIRTIIFLAKYEYKWPEKL